LTSALQSSHLNVKYIDEAIVRVTTLHYKGAVLVNKATLTYDLWPALQLQQLHLSQLTRSFLKGSWHQQSCPEGSWHGSSRCLQGCWLSHRTIPSPKHKDKPALLLRERVQAQTRVQPLRRVRL